MGRSLASGLAWMILGVAGLTAARAQTPEELTRTARYLEAFQNPDGGFAGGVGQPSSLGATSSVVRTLGFVGGAIRDVPGAIAFVKSCHDPKTGGFAQRPGGTPDVGSTASGLMAVAALKLDVGPYAEAAIGYLAKNVSGFENIRIAVAGLEAVKATSPDFARWTAQVLADRNPDGTFGQGNGMARATGSATVALLRMGFALEPEKKATVLAALRAAQKPDGGWSRGDGPSDLETSYRIMRLFFMLKEKPDLDRLRQYLSKHRASDGGYAPAPGQAESPGGTYFCAIMNLWARQLDGEPALFETAGFVPLTTGKDLTGWEGDSALWSMKDGVVVGESPGIKANNFLATEASYGDFILKFNVRLSGDLGNSGVQFRSVRLPGHEMSGYQADIGPGWWGNLYDESRRNKNLAEASTKARDAIHKGDWNSYLIRAMGGEITFNINGVESIKYVEKDDAIAREGRIALQLHAGGPMKVEFKDLYIQPLPSPKADGSSRPGFHLKTVATPQGERKYTVYVPEGYDGTRPYPAVLFLHGSGERGDDGIRGGQIGLGAAILAHPDRFPALAVLPQASKTWEASSDDAKAALAALDAVMADYKVAPDRVALTGLSMGGAGAWSIAAAEPGRWSCVVPVCGRGKTEMAKVIQTLPTWVVVGDMDRDDTVRNAREMVQALKETGATVRSTEYRAVGHNSWDRAYNDPALIAWMLEQTRKKP